MLKVKNRHAETQVSSAMLFVECYSECNLEQMLHLRLNFRQYHRL